MTMSGLRIFAAFPSFGPKIPQKNLIDGVPAAISLGGWLGGALQWHFTFMWIFAAGGLLYVVSQLASGHYRTVIFTPRDVRGVWPMVRHYFFFGPKPAAAGSTTRFRSWRIRARLVSVPFLCSPVSSCTSRYSCQRWAYCSAAINNARTIHFLAMCGMLAFIPGHLVMWRCMAGTTSRRW
jgi:thiosulfate reductase cytochrome b subunit